MACEVLTEKLVTKNRSTGSEAGRESEWFDSTGAIRETVPSDDVVMSRVEKIKSSWSDTERLVRKLVGDARREKLMEMFCGQ